MPEPVTLESVCHDLINSFGSGQAFLKGLLTRAMTTRNELDSWHGVLLFLSHKMQRLHDSDKPDEPTKLQGKMYGKAVSLILQKMAAINPLEALGYKVVIDSIEDDCFVRERPFEALKGFAEKAILAMDTDRLEHDIDETCHEAQTRGRYAGTFREDGIVKIREQMGGLSAPARLKINAAIEAVNAHPGARLALKVD